MTDKVLFEIKESSLESGLRGVPAGYCTTSQVHPTEGLTYRGISIKDLAFKDPEEVIYLLLYGKLPKHDEVTGFKQELRKRSFMNHGVVESLRVLPKDAHPMKWLISGINALGMYHGSHDTREDCLRVIALIPELVAAIYRIRSDWGEYIDPKPELGYMENFCYMLNPPAHKAGLGKLMRVFNILHYDHGGGNVSTFAAKVVSSAYSDVYESLTASMCGLAGPLHGKANEEALAFLKGMETNIKNVDDEVEIHNYLEDLFARGEKIFGFGHAVLRVEDLRATVEYELGEEIASDSKYFRLAKTLRKVGPDFLKKQAKVTNPYPNVDAVSGSLLNANGLEDEQYYSVLFGLSRCVGIACQLIYERLEARGGKGTPIIRPKFVYSGPKQG